MSKFQKVICLLLFVTTLSIGSSLSAHDSNSSIETVPFETVYEDEHLSFKVIENLENTAITSLKYSRSRSLFQIETLDNIEMLRILDSNQELVFMIPIGSNKLDIALSSFEKGFYFVQLKLKDKTEYLTAEMIKK